MLKIIKQLFTARKPTDLEMDAHLTRYLDVQMPNIMRNLVENIDPSDIASHMSDYDVAQQIEVDYCELSDYVDNDELASAVDLNDLSDNISLFDLSDHVDLDCISEHVAEHLNTEDLVSYISERVDYNELARAVVDHIDTSRIVDGVKADIDLESFLDIQDIVDRVMAQVGDAISGAV